MNWAFQEYVKDCYTLCKTVEQKKVIDSNLADVYTCFMCFKDPREALEMLHS